MFPYGAGSGGAGYRRLNRSIANRLLT